MVKKKSRTLELDEQQSLARQPRQENVRRVSVALSDDDGNCLPGFANSKGQKQPERPEKESCPPAIAGRHDLTVWLVHTKTTASV